MNLKVLDFNLNEKLNLIDITIKDSATQEKLAKYSNWHYKYRFINYSNIIVISSTVVRDTKVIFLVFNRLADARTSLINGKNMSKFRSNKRWGK